MPPREFAFVASTPTFGRAAFVCVALAFSSVISSCSDKDRQLGPREALKYRRNLVIQHHHQLSPEQHHRLMYHPGRTQREIDTTFEEYRQQYREQVARDAVSAHEAREGAEGRAEYLRRAAESGGGADLSAVGGAGAVGAGGPGGTSGAGRGPGGSDLPDAPPIGGLDEGSSGGTLEIAP